MSAEREPIWAHVYDTAAHYIPGQLATCGLGRVAEPRIETEIAFHVHRQDSYADKD